MLHRHWSERMSESENSHFWKGRPRKSDQRAPTSRETPPGLSMKEHILPTDTTPPPKKKTKEGKLSSPVLLQVTSFPKMLRVLRVESHF